MNNTDARQLALSIMNTMMLRASRHGASTFSNTTTATIWAAWAHRKSPSTASKSWPTPSTRQAAPLPSASATGAKTTFTRFATTSSLLFLYTFN